MQLSNFLKFLTIYNTGQSNLKTSYFCACNTVLKKIMTLYTKRVIVSHMSGIIDLWPNKHKANLLKHLLKNNKSLLSLKKQLLRHLINNFKKNKEKLLRKNVEMRIIFWAYIFSLVLCRYHWYYIMLRSWCTKIIIYLMFQLLTLTVIWTVT
jgi:hypothetical protein